MTPDESAVWESVKSELKDANPSNAYSQSGEDGVIEAIFARIGTANKWCLEVGAADGLFFSNTRKLVEAGWTGVYIEGDEAEFKRLTRNCTGLQTHLFNFKIDRDRGLDEVLSQTGAPTDIDLVSIDVDGQDFYVWNATLRYRPRVVVIEFDPINPDENFIPTLGGEGQAGIEAIMRLGIGRSYLPVWRTHTNLIFIDRSRMRDAA